MGAAFGWGTLAASSLVIGAVVAILFRIGLRAIGLIMGFGAGVLISAVAFDLVEEAASKSTGHGWLVGGFFAGCLVFSGGDRLIDRLGGGSRKDASGSQESNSSLSIVLGTVLDGVPESMVIGLTIFEGGAIGAAYLAAVFLSNLPESISSTSGLLASGWHKSRILWMWIGIALVSGACLSRRLRPLPELVAGCRRVRSHLCRRRDHHHARRDDDARSIRERRKAGRRNDGTRIRDRIHHPPARLTAAFIEAHGW
jgi:ZIP family zinc transporter